MRWITRDDWACGVAAFAQLTHERQLAQERHVERISQLRAAAVRKDLVAMVTLAAQVIAHVLDHAENRHMNFLEHRNAALDVEQRNVLRRRHDHAAIQRNTLRDRQLRVAGAGWQVEYQAIQLTPLDVEQKFGLELGDHRPTRSEE